MEYGTDSGGVCEALSWSSVEYGSESGSMWNMAESGGVWNMAPRVEVCGIWL